MWDETNKPKTWQDFVGNAGAVQQCKDWIKNFQNKEPNTPRVLIISGPEGCGKSLAADLLLKKQGYKSYAFGVKEIKKHKGDKNSLDNFCNLYMTNLSELGAASARRQTHGIILEDYDGLTKSDKKFNKTIVDLVKKNPSPATPLIVTTTESNLAKQSTGLLRLALVVTFQRLLVKDLVRVALRIAAEQQLYLDNDQADFFAQKAHGDARQLALSMEMFYINIPKNTKITIEQIELFTDSSHIESDEKICMSVEGGLSAIQSDDERILGMAIGDRGDKRSLYEQQAAVRLVLDNSQQFAPYLFQAYTKCLPARFDRHSMMSKTLTTAADIAEDMSMGEVMREATWTFDGHYELAATMMIENPIKRLRLAHSDPDDTKNFNVDIKGYQSYYGTENTLQNQLTIIATLRHLDPSIPNDMGDLSMLKDLYKHMFDSMTDMELVETLFPIHPEIIATIARLKLGHESFTVTKTKLKRLLKCYDELVERNKPRVKFIEHPQPQPPPQNTSDPSDPFVLHW